MPKNKVIKIVQLLNKSNEYNKKLYKNKLKIELSIKLEEYDGYYLANLMKHHPIISQLVNKIDSEYLLIEDVKVDEKDSSDVEIHFKVKEKEQYEKLIDTLILFAKSKVKSRKYVIKIDNKGEEEGIVLIKIHCK